MPLLPLKGRGIFGIAVTQLPVFSLENAERKVAQMGIAQIIEMDQPLATINQASSVTVITGT